MNGNILALLNFPLTNAPSSQQMGMGLLPEGLVYRSGDYLVKFNPALKFEFQRLLMPRMDSAYRPILSTM